MKHMKKNIMKRHIFVISVLLLSYNAHPTHADRKLSVTIYNQDFGVVKDVRTISVDPKTKLAEVSDISASIEPRSVQIRAIDDPKFSVSEQNFEYDIANRNKLLSYMIGMPIKVVLDDGKIFEGTLLAIDWKYASIRNKAGSIKLINLDEHLCQMIFPKMPKEIRLLPALVWKVSNDGRRQEKVEITYQTSKLSWHTDYNVLLNPINKSLSMNSWVTITNKSGTSFRNAHLKVVAGSVHKVKQMRYLAENRNAIYLAKRVAPEAPKGFEERNFSEYHLYDLGRKTTIKNNETKQIELFDVSNIKYKLEYIFDTSESPLYGFGSYSSYNLTEQAQPLSVAIVFANNKDNNLGIPLPGGNVRIYQKDSRNTEQLIGKDKIEHIAKDEQVRLIVAKAFDVLGTRKIINKRKIGNSEMIYDVEIKIRNHKTNDIPVIVREQMNAAYYWNWSIERNNVEYKKIDYRTIEFRFNISGNSEKVIYFRTHYKRYNW